MIQTLGWRCAQAGMVAFLVGILSFLMMQALPGDMVFRIAAARFGYDNVSAENAELVRNQIGDPAGFDAFLAWISGLLHGDLGSSLVTGREGFLRDSSSVWRDSRARRSGHSAVFADWPHIRHSGWYAPRWAGWTGRR